MGRGPFLHDVLDGAGFAHDNERTLPDAHLAEGRCVDDRRFDSEGSSVGHQLVRSILGACTDRGVARRVGMRRATRFL